MGKLMALIMGMLSLIFITVVIGLFFVKLGWALFMVPVFHMPEISWLQALGFSLLASCFKATVTK